VKTDDARVGAFDLSLAGAQVDVDLCARLIEWVCEDAGLPEGAVLVFLPGWDEINRLRQVLQTPVSSLAVMSTQLNLPLSPASVAVGPAS
jgi:HrpA-like RNA helicase